MIRYQYRGPVVEVCWFRDKSSIDDMKSDWGDRFTDVATYYDFADALAIDTETHIMLAKPGDFIIRDEHGRFLVVKKEVFIDTYFEC